MNEAKGETKHEDMTCTQQSYPDKGQMLNTTKTDKM